MSRYMFLSNLCVVVLRPSQPIRGMSSVVSLPIHTFPGQAESSKQLTIISLCRLILVIALQTCYHVGNTVPQLI